MRFSMNAYTHALSKGAELSRSIIYRRGTTPRRARGRAAVRRADSGQRHGRPATTDRHVRLIVALNSLWLVSDEAHMQPHAISTGEISKATFQPQLHTHWHWHTHWPRVRRIRFRYIFDNGYGRLRCCRSDVRRRAGRIATPRHELRVRGCTRRANRPYERRTERRTRGGSHGDETHPDEGHTRSRPEHRGQSCHVIAQLAHTCAQARIPHSLLLRLVHVDEHHLPEQLQFLRGVAPPVMRDAISGNQHAIRVCVQLQCFLSAARRYLSASA